MTVILQAIIASLLPVSELRGGIPLAIAQGMNPVGAYVVCVLANILVIPLVYFFLTYFHKHFMKIKFYKNTFNHHLEKSRKKLDKYVGTNFEFIALMLFVGIPLPITGAYTGTLLAWFFGIPKKRTYLALSLGVLISGIIVTLVTILGISGLEFLIKNNIMP